MQFALQDLRKWGYKKIFQKFAPDDTSREEFFLDINHLSELCDSVDVTKCSAFTFPKKWGSIRNACASKYIGMKTFIYYCEPMIDNIEVDETCQRKFRNQWQSLWKAVMKVFDLSEQEVKILDSFGIRLAFMQDIDMFSFAIPDRVMDFYDVVLNWFVLTQSECSFDSQDITPLELVEVLIISDSDSFISFVRDNCS